MATSVNCPTPKWLKLDNKKYRCRFCGFGAGNHVSLGGDREKSHQEWEKMHQIYNNCGWVDYLSHLTTDSPKLKGLEWLKIRRRQKRSAIEMAKKWGLDL